MNIFKQWMMLATVVEQKDLARRTKTSPGYLYQIATGRRKASADIAGRIETASKVLRKTSKNRLPLLTRADVCPACSVCSYAQKCLKGRA